MKKAAFVTVPVLCVSLCTSAFAAFPRIVEEEDLSSYITLGEYKGLSVEKTVEEVTDEDVDAWIESAVSQTTEEFTEGVVGNGDTAVIDYEGKKDDVAFDGGTATDYPLVIGSGTFIPGFEEGVEGMEVGETKDIPLTFPEQYQNEELAGADVIFTVTVKSIRRTPELSEAWVEKNTDYASIEEYQEGVKKRLIEDAEMNADLMAAQDVFTQVWQDSEIKDYPEELLEAGRAFMDQYTESYAQMYGVEKDAFIEAQGYTQEQYDAMVDQYAENRAGQFLVIQAIIDDAELDLEDDVTQEIIDGMLEQYGMKDLAELRATYGEAEVNASIALERVQRFLIENADVTVIDGAAKSAEDGELSMQSEVGDADFEEETGSASEETDVPETETTEDVTEEPAEAAEDAEPADEGAEG